MRTRKIKTKIGADGNPETEPAIVRTLPNGDVNVQFTWTDEQMKLFYQACNMLSAELGRPVSMEETLVHVVRFTAKNRPRETNGKK